MSRQIKSKFSCVSVTETAYATKEAKLQAQYSATNPEDNQFAKSTPSGSIDISISNPDAMDFIKPGKKYYVYFEECENQE